MTPEIEQIIEDHREEFIDLRPFFIPDPHFVYTNDRMQKALNVFRFNHLRQLCVIDYNDNSLKGIITRQSLFSYMSL